MSPAGSVLPKTFHRVPGKQFVKFLRRTHDETMQKTSAFLKDDGVSNSLEQLRRLRFQTARLALFS